MKKQPHNSRAEKPSWIERKPSNDNNVSQTQNALAKAKIEFEKQKNVLVKVPSTSNKAGYTVILDVEEAKKKYPAYAHIPVV